MFGLLRLVVVLAVALTVVYWSLALWLDAGERDRLEAEWERDRPPLPRHTYVENGIRDYRSRRAGKMLWGVYIVPITAICVLIYLLNYD